MYLLSYNEDKPVIIKYLLNITLVLVWSMLSGRWTTSSAQLNPRNLTQYTELDGVPASEVSSILSDRQGYIWVGTLNGLARYDGYEFKRFFNNPNDPGSIKGLQVWALFEDRKGQIWVATGPENLNVYNPITRAFKKYEYKHLIAHPANVELGITAICEDPKGIIYFGVTTNLGETIPSGILYLDEVDSTIHRFFIPDSVNMQNVVRMTGDAAGNVWIITYTGLYKIDTLRQWSKFNDWNRVFEKTGDFPVNLEFGKDGHLWIISVKSVLYEFDPKSDKHNIYTPVGPSTESVRNTLAIDRIGNVWVGINRGISLFNRKTTKFEVFNYESDHPLERAHVLDIKPDEFGNIWVGTRAHGMFKYEEKVIFKSYGYNKEQKGSLTSGWANNIYESHNGQIFITTSGLRETSGMNIMDPEGKSILSIYYPNLATDEVSGFIEYAPNEFYLGTWQGVFRFSLLSQQVKKINFEGFPNEVLVQKFIEDKKGNFWLGTTSGLYRKANGSSGFIKYDLSLNEGANASSNEITGAFESAKHGLWLLTNNGLFLYHYETDKIERHGFDHTKGDVLVTQDVNSFYEDSAGLAWVGTWQGGLSRYHVESKEILTYTLDDGLPSMSIQSILADEKKGALWLSTFEGLSRFDLKEKKFYNYSLADGIQGQLFADGAALKTSKGLFIFGGSNGITLFNPDLITESTIPPKVFFTDFKLFDQSIIPGENSILKKPIQETNEIILKSTENTISLEFTAIHYSNPAKNRSVYRLEGYDSEWRDAGNQQLAFYSKLPAGQYTFRVKAANNNGVWNEEGASIKINILPPWWKTTWAYIMYFILLIGGGFALDRYLRHRVREKEREKYQAKQLEQAKEIEKAYLQLEQTHESLKATQAQLIQSEKMASLGELTAGIAHEIQNPLNFVNNFSEINKELFEEIEVERRKPSSLNDSIHPARPDGTVGREIRNEALEQELLSTIRENQDKILQHGKRADAIVKGMLQHSRISSVGAGEKEPVDINALVEEYFRLAYHGLRAKDKTFNTTMESDFDPSIGNINIIPQDIGRVILNLINNAFYAVSARLALVVAEEAAMPTSASNSNQSIRSSYEPVVKVSTKKLNHHIEIRVKDNGIGIPKKNLEKIFQPFFTTKPVGQGTGLGLSISYDIVKANGGEIKVISNYRPPGGEIKVISHQGPPEGDLKVNSIEGEGPLTLPGGLTGSEFIIQLPIT